MVLNTKFFLEHECNPVAVPILASKAVRLRAMPQKFRNQSLLAGCQFGGTTGTGVCAKRRPAPVPSTSDPIAHRPCRQVQGLRNGTLPPSMPDQIPGSYSTPFPPVVWIRFLPDHTVSLAKILTNFIAHRSVKALLPAILPQAACSHTDNNQPDR
jgi:hypothetical protein